jgi:hypothetical protein
MGADLRWRLPNSDLLYPGNNKAACSDCNQEYGVKNHLATQPSEKLTDQLEHPS